MPSGEHLKSAEPAPNKQLYKNSDLSHLFADAPQRPDALFNAKEPNLQIMHEKPEHRWMLWMKAQGSSNREIAQETGYSESWLSQLFRQPWAREVVLDMMKASGKGTLERVLARVEGEVMNSLDKLVDVRDNPETPPAVVRACSVDIIEQFLGKPKQKMDITQQVTTIDVAETDKEIARLEAEEKRLMGRFETN